MQARLIRVSNEHFKSPFRRAKWFIRNQGYAQCRTCTQQQHQQWQQMTKKEAVTSYMQHTCWSRGLKKANPAKLEIISGCHFFHVPKTVNLFLFCRRKEEGKSRRRRDRKRAHGIILSTSYNIIISPYDVSVLCLCILRLAVIYHLLHTSHHTNAYKHIAKCARRKRYLSHISFRTISASSIRKPKGANLL